ncbi:MAG: DUF3083 family protein [Thalassotalea sp.]
MRTGSILRKRRASEKVYVPKDARDNQYVIAEMPLTDELLELVAGKVDLTLEKPYQKFYQTLAKIAFDVVEECNIAHANFVANSRLVRVRHSDEQQVLHTPQQTFFFYSPLHNSTFKGYFEGEHRSTKVKFLFLATGDELRVNSGAFHKKVFKAVKEISKRIGLAGGELKVRDHQHLTYDIFAKEKGRKETIPHTFREISARYLQQGYEIEGEHTYVTYAIVNVPMSRRLLKNVELDYNNDDMFAPLYEKIEKAFKASAEKHNLTHAAMIANGNTVIVRYDKEENTIFNGEIISLGFNPKNDVTDIVSLYEPDQLVDNIRLVYFADEYDETHRTYGKFVNQVTQSIITLANELDWNKERDYMLMRLHQQLVRKV